MKTFIIISKRWHSYRVLSVEIQCAVVQTTEPAQILFWADSEMGGVAGGGEMHRTGGSVLHASAQTRVSNWQHIFASRGHGASGEGPDEGARGGVGGRGARQSSTQSPRPRIEDSAQTLLALQRGLLKPHTPPEICQNKYLRSEQIMTEYMSKQIMTEWKKNKKIISWNGKWKKIF
jgi:hypothetical protein